MNNLSAIYLAASLLTSPAAFAFNPQPDPPATLAYVSFDLYNSVETFANGINNQGVIAGYSDDGITLAHGYKLAGGALNSFTAPGAVRITEHDGINAAGTVSGAYYDGANLLGYVLSSKGFTPLDPGCPRSVAWGLNDTGKVVGSYEPGGSTERGFLWNGSTFIDLMAPGRLSTQARDIDSSGRIVGSMASRRLEMSIQASTCPATSPTAPASSAPTITPGWSAPTVTARPPGTASSTTARPGTASTSPARCGPRCTASTTN
ncbi:hypothetical protein BH11PSE10_BH11PSE10_03170 [soil metagenome]